MPEGLKIQISMLIMLVVKNLLLKLYSPQYVEKEHKINK